MPGGGLGAGDLELKALTYDYSTYMVLKRAEGRSRSFWSAQKDHPEVLKDARGATVRRLQWSRANG